MKLSVGAKIIIPVIGLVAMIGGVSVVVQHSGSNARDQAMLVKDYEVPKATLTLSLIDELGDMNSNVLEYASGESDEVEQFHANKTEFEAFLNEYKTVVGEDDPSAKEITAQFEQYSSAVQSKVLNTTTRISRLRLSWWWQT